MLNVFSTLGQLIEHEQIITGDQAIRLSGMQNSLIEQITKQNLYFASMTSFIVSDFDNCPPFNAPGVPKPPHIHSKTSSLVGGYIPLDPIFTRLGLDRRPLGHHSGDDLTNQESVQVRWTLWEILKRCGVKGDLIMDWPNDGCSIVRFSFKSGREPLGFFGCFQLDLGEERKKSHIDPNAVRVVTREWDDPEKYLALIPTKILEAFYEGREQIIRIPYKIFYNTEKNGSFKPLMVFAVGGKPIIGDLDKDLESLPLCIGISDLKASNTEYNTFILNLDSTGISEQIKLIDATKKLFMNLLYKNLVFQNSFNECFLLGLDPNSTTLIYDAENVFYTIAIKTSLLARAGVVTPYEFLRNILTNHVHNYSNANKGLSDYFNDPFQHGVDLRNPFNLDKTISHDYDGGRFHVFSEGNSKVWYVYTRNQDQRIKLYLLPGFLETNFIHVSPTMDMQKWHIIIEKQIELKQQELIYPATMLAYKKYKKSPQIQTDPRPLLGINVWPLNSGKKTISQPSIASNSRESSQSPSRKLPQSPDLGLKKPNKIVATFLKLKTTIFSTSGSTQITDQQYTSPVSSPDNIAAPFRSMDATSSAILTVAQDKKTTVSHRRSSSLLRSVQDKKSYDVEFTELPMAVQKEQELNQRPHLLEQSGEPSDPEPAQIPESVSSCSVLIDKAKPTNNAGNIRGSIVCPDSQIKLHTQDDYDEQEEDLYSLKPMGVVLEKLKLLP
jgi:hypothetical protein